MKHLWSSFLILLFASTVTLNGQQTLPEWKEGMLDIHFISTGSGNCDLIVMPDGTTMLVDAGEMDPTSPRVLSPRNTRRFPNYSKLAYQWQSEYIQAMLPSRKGGSLLDYALVTHYHDDHYGSVYPGVVKSEKGDYYLSGITGVGELIGFRTFVDRGWNYPVDLRKEATTNPRLKSLANYFSFIDFAVAHTGMRYQPFVPGSSAQFVMCNNPSAHPSFSIQNIQANGIVVKEGKPVTLMPSPESITRTAIPSENHLSTGILLKYGSFKCYLGADIPGSAPAYEERPTWHDVESLVAPIVGEVDVTTTNHHANRDAMTPFYLSILKPRVIIQEVWSSDHPGHEALIRMTSQKIWQGERDLFATAMLEANRLVIGDLIEKSYRSLNGHILLRVEPGGKQYRVYILNSETESRHVAAIHGPYQTKEK